MPRFNYKQHYFIIIFVLIIQLIIHIHCIQIPNTKPLPSKKSLFLDNELINNPFEIVNEWKYLDFEYPTYQRRQEAIANNEFIIENNLPLGIDISIDRIFITTPRWKDGVPASLGYLPYPPKELSPQIRPYPNWNEHGDPYQPDCNKLISVYRTQIDECNRLWVIDSGIINATVQLTQICPPKIIAYNLKTDERVIKYELPPDQIKQESLHSNIIIDIRNGNCMDAYAYVTDVWRYGIVVFSLFKNKSWRTTNHLYYPNPIASDFHIYDLNFQWPDGAFGMSLSPINNFNDRLLFFHPMASFQEFMISTAVLRDETLWLNGGKGASQSVFIIGDRGLRGQSSTSGIDKNYVMFFTLVQQDAIGCWDTNKPYIYENLHIIGENTSGIIFPNDLKVDREYDQNVWVMSNKLPIFLYSKLDLSEINFRILRANIDDAINGTQCDPRTLTITNTQQSQQIEQDQQYYRK